MTAIILQADARQLPLPDDSVDLIVTSPPYFALRSYQDGGAHYDGQRARALKVEKPPPVTSGQLDLLGDLA